MQFLPVLYGFRQLYVLQAVPSPAPHVRVPPSAAATTYRLSGLARKRLSSLAGDM